MAIWYSFGQLVPICMFTGFGMLYREKYGNPGMPTTVFLIDYLSST
jgi:hypothetical protein